MEQEAACKESWLLDILTRLSPDTEEITLEGTPEEMTRDAAAVAFRISTAAGAVPGAFGMAAIVPEVAAIARLQVRLVHKIAAYHGQEASLTQGILLSIFANVLGVAAGESFVKKAGTALALRALTSDLAKRLADKVGVEIVTTVVERSVLRWIPVLSAPVFGLFSRVMTMRIGMEADAFFRRSQTEPG